MLRSLLVVLIASFVTAQQPQTVLLWPDGAPGALGNEAKDQPKLTIYRAPSDDDNAKPKPAIVVCPGGGYRHLAMDHEGKQIAAWLNSIGITAAVLDYRHRGKGYGHPAPLQDVQRAMRTVRARKGEWRIDAQQVGVLGFSAGGHLAASASVHHDHGTEGSDDTIEQHSCRPDFAILCYPVIAFDQPFSNRGSQRSLLGKNPDPQLLAHMSPERHVDERTPPTFLWHTTADRVVPPKNSIVYYLALLEHAVPCELHLFEKGRHGLGLAKGKAAEAWSKLCQRWLVTRGVLAR